MNDFFYFDSKNHRLVINDEGILCVKEFKDLLNRDPIKFFKELTYIYLAICWRSPYSLYSELERHEEALNDAELTEEEFNDPVFRSACRKYRELQDSNKSIKLLEAARKAADLFTEYFDTIVDLNERDQTGKPVFNAEKVMKEMANLHKVHEELVILEDLVKKELTEQSTTRAGVEKGFYPGKF